jgi:hypothetical protein
VLRSHRHWVTRSGARGFQNCVGLIVSADEIAEVRKLTEKV